MAGRAAYEFLMDHLSEVFQKIRNPSYMPLFPGLQSPCAPGPGRLIAMCEWLTTPRCSRPACFRADAGRHGGGPVAQHERRSPAVRI